MLSEYPPRVTVSVRLQERGEPVYEHLSAQPIGDLYLLWDDPEDTEEFEFWDLVRCEQRADVLEVVEVIQRGKLPRSFAVVWFSEKPGEEYETSFLKQIAALGGWCERLHLGANETWRPAPPWVIWADQGEEAAAKIAHLLDSEEAEGRLGWTYLLGCGLQHPPSPAKLILGAGVDSADCDLITVTIMVDHLSDVREHWNTVNELIEDLARGALSLKFKEISERGTFMIKVPRDPSTLDTLAKILDDAELLEVLEWYSDKRAVRPIWDRIHEWLNAHADEYEDVDELAQAMIGQIHVSPELAGEVNSYVVESGWLGSYLDSRT